jgi:hypothetical protein
MEDKFAKASLGYLYFEKSESLIKLNGGKKWLKDLMI